MPDRARSIDEATGCPRPVLPDRTSRRDVVDLVHLARFTLGNEDLEREVLELFIEQSPVYLAALQSAGNDQRFQVAAHTLKGSARAVGAWHMADAAEAAEQAGRSGNREARAGAIDAVVAGFEEARRYIVALLSSRRRGPAGGPAGGLLPA